jgi:MFS family permease
MIHPKEFLTAADRHDFGELYGDIWILPSLWLGLWNFISPGCAMVGAMFGGWFQDRFGRRASLGVGTVLSAIGVAISFLSGRPLEILGRRGMFLAGKGFQGAAIGMVLITVQTYMSEILPPALRGSILGFFPAFTLLGQLIGGAVIFVNINRDQGYTICFATQWAFSLIPLAMAFVIPESPTYLVRMGKTEEALKSQQKLDCPGMDSQRTVDILVRNIEHEKTQARATYVDCFKPPNLRRTLIIVYANCLPQLFGLTILAKASYFVQLMGMEASTSVLTLILGIVLGFMANLVGIWTTSRVGRRPLIVYTMSFTGLLWLGMGIAACFPGKVAMW